MHREIQTQKDGDGQRQRYDQGETKREEEAGKLNCILISFKSL